MHRACDRRDRDADSLRHLARERLIDLGEERNHPLADRQALDLAELEATGVHQMGAFRR
jgi:hypothetical protein